MFEYPEVHPAGWPKVGQTVRWEHKWLTGEVEILEAPVTKTAWMKGTWAFETTIEEEAFTFMDGKWTTEFMIVLDGEDTVICKHCETVKKISWNFCPECGANH